MKSEIKYYLKSPVRHKIQAIRGLCNGKTVLDIGCVGQDKFYDNPGWLHHHIKQTASELTGVDIVTEHKAILASKGYTLLSPEELKNSGKTVDVIVMADVIEHVSNTAEFLLFYRQFLKPGGQIVVTTPNPFSIRRVMSVLLYGNPGVNPEHTQWLDPLTMDELLSRLDFKIQYFCWLHEYSKPHKLRYYFLYPFFQIIYSFRKFFAPNFLMVITSAKA